MKNSKNSDATIQYEELWNQFNQYVSDSGFPEHTLSKKGWVEFYDYAFVDGAEAAAKFYLHLIKTKDKSLKNWINEEAV